jgi:ABC-2 type transport system permease protein
MRDKFGLFWVAVFPLLMALFFGSIFSDGGGTGAGSMKIAIINDNQSEAALDFYEEFGKAEVLNVQRLPLDSARMLVAQGKLTAYVQYRDTSSSPITMFGGQETVPIEVGIDPSRKAERGYLNGLITQAWFTSMQKKMMNPSSWTSSLDAQLTSIDSATGLSGEQRQYLKGFMGDLRSFMGTIDTTNDTSDSALAQNSPFAGVEIEFTEITVAQSGPRSSWEITFPQSLQWALIGVCAAFAISIVMERTRGTFLRLRLAPIGRMQILAGKGLACFIASVLVSLILILFGMLVFGIRISSILHLAMALCASGICFVGLMMFISVLGKTEQAVAGAGWAILLVMAMTGGGMIPLFAMPDWLSTIGSFSAVKWSVMATEGAIWRDLTTMQLLTPVGILSLYGVVFFFAGVYILRRSDR